MGDKQRPYHCTYCDGPHPEDICPQRCASPASGAAPQPPAFEDWWRSWNARPTDDAKLKLQVHVLSAPYAARHEAAVAAWEAGISAALIHAALAAPAPSKREVEWVIVAEGEGAEARLVFDADPHEEIHRFMCVCGKPWRECTTDGMREDVARFDDPDEWGFDEAGKPYSVAWRHETGTVKIFRVRAALEAAAAEGK